MEYRIKISSSILFVICFLAGLILFSGGKWKSLSHDTFYNISIPSKVNPNQLKINILHYDLSFDIYAQDSFIKGDAVITGVITDKSLETIDLDFYDNMKIDRITYNGKETAYSFTDNILSIKKGEGPDTFNVEIKYEGTPKHAGLSGFVFGEISKFSVVYNLNEPDFACTWFPCNDIPSDKAFLDIRITNDSSMVSVSNGKLKNVELKGGRRTYHWETLYPISTYLVCVYSSRYVNFSDSYISQDKKDTLPLEYYVFPNHLENGKKDFEDHKKFLQFFAETFGEYPFIKEKYGVAEFLWQFGAMEHQTITGIGSNFVTGKKFFNDVYIHELAHHWWGDAVSPASWKDIWLNEGFATYSEALYAEHTGGKEALQASMLNKMRDNFDETLYNPKDNMFGTTVYDKGGWVLHMLRKETGDSLFFKILRTYFETYKYKNASTEDFKKLCETISGKDFTKFFDQWIYTGMGKIEVEYEWKAEKSESGYKMTVSMDQIQKEYKTYNFPVEFTFTTEEGKPVTENFYIDARHKEFEFELKDKPKEVEADPGSWVLGSFKERKK